MLHSAVLNVMIKAAHRAGRSLKRDLGEVEHLQVSVKGPRNFVCAADHRAEAIVREELAKARPDYGFLGEEGGASAILGREVFNRLDVKIKEVNLGPDAALNRMRIGQVFATLLVSGKPVNLLGRYAQPDSIHFLHFLPVPASSALEHDYLPTTLSHDDYPDIIAAGERVDTIAVQTALFTYNWPIRSERFRLLESFVQTFFSRFPEFLDDSHHPKWREVNLEARLPGWQRFGPAERWLQRPSAGEAAISGAMDEFLRRNPNLPHREELLKDFQWLLKSKQGR